MILCNNPYRALEKALGYRFRHKHWLEAALTHPSYRFETPEVKLDNQRLEFLGDAALSLAAAGHLFEHRPTDAEGRLTQVRSMITNTRILAEIAQSIGLGPYLRLGKGERISGGAEREKNLTDAMEAVIGAAFQDGGYRAVQKIFEKLFVPLLDKACLETWVENPKGYLQELSQRRWHTNPRYQLVRTDGPAHSPRYHVDVFIGDRCVGEGSAMTKRDAEGAAALNALEKLTAE